MVLESKRTKNKVKSLWCLKRCVVGTQQTLVGVSCNEVNFGGYQFLAFWQENLPPSAGDHHGSRDP